MTGEHIRYLSEEMDRLVTDNEALEVTYSCGQCSNYERLKAAVEAHIEEQSINGVPNLADAGLVQALRKDSE
jgi:hypothetical protein